MKSTATIFDHDFDLQMISELEELRNVRLGLAKKQLANIEQTAFDLQSSGLYDHIADDLLVTGIKIELMNKIEILKSRISQKGIFYTDEIQFYLSIADETLPA